MSIKNRNLELIELLFIIMFFATCFIKGIDSFNIRTNNNSNIIIENFGNVSDPSLVLCGNKYILAFCSDIDGSKDIWVSTSSNIINWNAPLKVTSNQYDDYDPCIIKTHSGKLHIAYTSIRMIKVIQEGEIKDEPDQNIWTTASEDGRKWSEPVQVSDRKQHGLYGTTGLNWGSFHSPAMIETRNSELLLSCVFYDTGCLGIPSSKFVICNSSDGTDWTNNYLYHMGTGLHYLNGTSIMQHSNGTYIIAYEDKIKNDIRGFLSFIDNFTVIGRIKYSGEERGEHPYLLEDRSDKINIFTDNGLWIFQNGSSSKDETYLPLLQASVIIRSNEPIIAYQENNKIMINEPIIDPNEPENHIEKKDTAYIDMPLIISIIILITVIKIKNRFDY